MSVYKALTEAAGSMAEVVRGVRPEHAGAATPCGAFLVRDLAAHLLHWSPVIEDVALRRSAEMPRPDRGGPAPVGDDWPERYLDWLDRILRAWAPEAAWEGEASLSGTVVPSRIIGEKTLVELVVHGWDLARATSQELGCADPVAAQAEEIFLATAEQTRAMGAFAPAVPVAGPASALERAVAAMGRDPHWTRG